MLRSPRSLSSIDTDEALAKSGDLLGPLARGVRGFMPRPQQDQLARRIAEALAQRGIPHVIAEQNRDLVDSLRRSGQAAVSGDAADPAVLVQAHIANARMLVIATPDTLNVRQMINTARTLNPEIEIVVRTHNEAEARLLESENAGKIFLGEEELAQSMTRHVLERSVVASHVVP